MRAVSKMEQSRHGNQSVFAVQHGAPNLGKVLSLQWRGIEDVQNDCGQKLFRGGLKEVQFILRTGRIDEHAGDVLSVRNLGWPAANFEGL